MIVLLLTMIGLGGAVAFFASQKSTIPFILCLLALVLSISVYIGCLGKLANQTDRNGTVAKAEETTEQTDSIKYVYVVQPEAVWEFNGELFSAEYHQYREWSLYIALKKDGEHKSCGMVSFEGLPTMPTDKKYKILVIKE